VRKPRLDPVTLVAGLVTVVLGVLLLLDQLGEVELGFGYTAPAVLAAAGAVFVASGLAGRQR
jgi:hypothetical protein